MISPQGTITLGLSSVTDRTPATPESFMLELDSESSHVFFLGQIEMFRISILIKYMYVSRI